MSPPRSMKPWTVMAYIVADPDENNQELNAAANAELQAIAEAAAKFQREMHVVSQVDFNGQRGIFRQVMDDNGVPTLTQSGCETDSTPGDRDVVRRFLGSASKEFPAERRVVIFWGHSFGPAGMFETDKDSVIVRPHRHRPFEARPITRILNMPDLASALGAAAGPDAHKVDLVIFKDCAMSTLETAFELSSIADFQIGSQSLIPVHLKNEVKGVRPPSVWPYEQLFSALAAHSRAQSVKPAATQMLHTLGDFYKVKNHLGQNDDVPVTLVDLQKLTDVRVRVNAFVHALKELNVLERSTKISAAAAGDPALVDVERVCAEFHRMPAAGALREAVAHHVVAHASRTHDFTGLSVFYRAPGLDLPGIVMPTMFPLNYSTLRFARTTTWDDLAFETNPLSQFANL
jgi:hypothetical protein